MGTNPKATIDTHRKRKKSPKHKSKDGHQTIREENRGREEKRLTKTNSKQLRKRQEVRMRGKEWAEGRKERDRWEIVHESQKPPV